MFEILVLILFVWLFIKAIGLALRVSWGLAKVIAAILFALAIPALFLCLLVVGGAAILVPIALLAAAIGILKVCI